METLECVFPSMAADFWCIIGFLHLWDDYCTLIHI